MVLQLNSFNQEIDFDKREEIRRYYNSNQEKILARDFGVSVYGVDIPMSPIEYDLWCSIRYLCLPFYLQYPVDRYFLDFGDPRRKIAIEADGKEWHQDVDKDRKRQKEIEKHGWSFIRFSGSEIYSGRAEEVLTNLRNERWENAMREEENKRWLKMAREREFLDAVKSLQ